MIHICIVLYFNICHSFNLYFFWCWRVLSALEDENGLRHMLLCRVILGNTEIIEASSKQFQPTCQDFDSGVDNYLAPKTYIIWPSNMNSHILPNFLVSFKGPLSLGKQFKMHNLVILKLLCWCRHLSYLFLLPFIFRYYFFNLFLYSFIF